MTSRRRCPGPGGGTLSPGGGAAQIRFDVRVNDGVPSGTIISNQAVVSPSSCRTS
jgi:hypothetical protein